MARYLYVSGAANAQTRATALGCGLMPTTPPEFVAQVAGRTPCAIVSGAGTTVVLPEPTTASAVTSAAVPIVAAENAANTATAAQNANVDTLRSAAVAALGNNITYLGVGAPTNAQVVAQVAALTRQVDALIRLVGQQLDVTTGT